MKRYFLGILMFLILFQPLVTKALANRVESYPNSTFSKEQLQAKHQEIPATLFENLVLDAEDEDDLSELENHTSQEAILIKTISPANFYSTYNIGIALNSNNGRSQSSSKPLYILWSVFRI